jgi:hypothetical protein
VPVPGAVARRGQRKGKKRSRFQSSRRRRRRRWAGWWEGTTKREFIRIIALLGTPSHTLSSLTCSLPIHACVRVSGLVRILPHSTDDKCRGPTKAWSETRAPRLPSPVLSLRGARPQFRCPIPSSRVVGDLQVPHSRCRKVNALFTPFVLGINPSSLFDALRCAASRPQQAASASASASPSAGRQTVGSLCSPTKITQRRNRHALSARFLPRCRLRDGGPHAFVGNRQAGPSIEAR